MLKIVAILVLSTTLKLAVENNGSWIERSFPNTARGAEELIAFAEQSIGDPPNGIRVVLGSRNEKDNQAHILKKFAEVELKHGIVSPGDVKAAATKYRISPESAIAVAKADEDRFGFIYRSKPKK